jgi:transposase
LVLFFPLGVWLPQRSAAAAKAGADSGAASRPDPEVVVKGKRRTYTAEYKQRILEEADAAAATRGAVGALLRREGLHFSLLTTWRRERASGIREALTSQRRGLKSKPNPFEEETHKLRRQVGQLTEKLHKAEIIIDVQKKSQRCWETRFPMWTQRRNPDVRGQ